MANMPVRIALVGGRGGVWSDESDVVVVRGAARAPSSLLGPINDGTMVACSLFRIDFDADFCISIGLKVLDGRARLFLRCRARR